jgi:exopolysaccharide biosynthesis protein
MGKIPSCVRVSFIVLLVVGINIGIVPVASAATPSPTKIVHSRSSWQKYTIKTPRGKFSGQVVAIDMTNPKLKIRTLTTTSGDCKTNCKVAPLMQFVKRVNGFAGINGTYFCPASYSQCKGQSGSTYWTVFNSLTKQFVNVEHQFGPMVVFDSENHWHFYRNIAFAWYGKLGFEQIFKTKITAAIASGPILVVDKKLSVKASELDVKQLKSKVSRGALAFKGKNMYFVITANATVLDLGAVVKAMGMELAINLDGGGSSALVFDGKYKVGPGRNIPNAIVVTEK